MVFHVDSLLVGRVTNAVSVVDLHELLKRCSSVRLFGSLKENIYLRSTTFKSWYSVLLYLLACYKTKTADVIVTHEKKCSTIIAFFSPG